MMKNNLIEMIKVASILEKIGHHEESDEILKIYQRVAQVNPTSTPTSKRGINNFVNPTEYQVKYYQKYIQKVADALKDETERINSGAVGKLWDKEKRKRHLHNFLMTKFENDLLRPSEFNRTLTSLQVESFYMQVDRLIEQLSDLSSMESQKMENDFLYKLIKDFNLTQEYIETNKVDSKKLEIMMNRALAQDLTPTQREQLKFHGRILSERARSFDPKAIF